MIFGGWSTYIQGKAGSIIRREDGVRIPLDPRQTNGRAWEKFSGRCTVIGQKTADMNCDMKNFDQISRKIISTGLMVKHWCGSPREAVEYQSTEIFFSYLYADEFG